MLEVVGILIVINLSTHNPDIAITVNCFKKRNKHQLFNRQSFIPSVACNTYAMLASYNSAQIVKVT